jgi:hypothetical protein
MEAVMEGIMAEVTTEGITAVTMDIMEDITAATIIMEGMEGGERDWAWEYWAGLAWAIMEAGQRIIVPLLMDTGMGGTDTEDMEDMATLPPPIPP